jgi:hypothetical protein
LLALACAGASAIAASTAWGGPTAGARHESAYLVSLTGFQRTDVVDRTAAGGSAGCAAAGGERQMIRFSTARPVRATLRGPAPLATLRLPVTIRIAGTSAGAAACGGTAEWTLAATECGPVSTRGLLTLRWVGFEGRVALGGTVSDRRSRRACTTTLARPYAFLVRSEARIRPSVLARHGVARITVGGHATVTDRAPGRVEKRTHVRWTLVLQRVR